MRGPRTLITHRTGCLDDFWVLDATSIVWARVTGSGRTGAPSPRQGPGLAWASGALWLYGGTYQGTSLSDLYLFNATTLEWTNVGSDVLGSPPIPRSDFSFVALNGALYLFGGRGPKDKPTPGKERCAKLRPPWLILLSPIWCGIRNDMHKFEVGGREWTPINPEGTVEWPAARQGAYLAAGDDGMLYLFGGDIGIQYIFFIGGDSPTGWSG